MGKKSQTKSVSGTSQDAVAEIFSIAKSSRSAHRELAARIRSRIVEGGLGYGIRLPTIRALASALQLNRNAVAKAFQELRSEGLISGRQRGGTWVCYVSQPQRRREPSANPNARWLPKHTPSGQLGADSVRWDLRPGQAFVHSLPVEVWRRACREAGRHLPPAGYGDPAGERELRNGLAGYLSRTRAYTISPDNVLVTGGSGAAIALIARALLRKGSIVAAEDPGYRRVVTEFERVGARVLAVPVEFETGMELGELPEGDRAPTILHVTPAHQYPLGTQLSAEKRLDLIKWARRNGTLIIENDYDHEFVYEGERLEPLAATAPDCVALLGTFSKALSPSIRIGFIAGPTQLIKSVRALVEINREQVSWPLQQTLLWLLRQGAIDGHIARNRGHYRELRDAIRTAFISLKSSFSLCGDAGGLHVIVRVSSGLDVRVVQRALRSAGILMERVGEVATWGRDLNALILGYGHLQLPDLRAAMKELTGVLKTVAQHRERRPEAISRTLQR